MSNTLLLSIFLATSVTLSLVRMFLYLTMRNYIESQIVGNYIFILLKLYDDLINNIEIELVYFIMSLLKGRQFDFLDVAFSFLLKL